MSEEQFFKHRVVKLIISKRPEQALKMLSEKFDVKPPDLSVKVVKGKSVSALGVYVPKKQAIYVKDSDVLFNPFVILHEFYHHLRTHPTKHRGTEKNADKFAHDFIKTYDRLEVE